MRLSSTLRPLTLALSLIGCKATDPASSTPADTGADETAAPPPSWPDWAWQHWAWEDESTQDSVFEMVDGYIGEDIPLGAIIIDSPWATGYNTFEWDTERFPDPQGMIDGLHDRDVRVMLWIVPGINVDVEPLYSEAADAGYFMEAEAGAGPAVVSWWKGEGSLIDFHNPEAVEWWHTLMQPVLDMGIDGWKCDGLDFAALTAPYSPGAGRELSRLEYSHAYYRDFYEHTRSELGDDRLITARPVDGYGADLGGDGVAFAPIDINWAGWVGDQDATFDGLRMALRNMYWSADYGYLAFGSDIGGYRDEDMEHGREKELLLRWAQVGAFNPVMENGGDGDHWPWKFDDETTQIYRTFVNLHHAILPYLDEHGARAYAAGESLMTFHSPDRYDFQLGPDIYMAPILESGGGTTASFPDDGDWVYIFDESQVYAGGTDQVLSVPLAQAAVFARAGSEALQLLTDSLAR